MLGRGGLFRQENMEKRKLMSPREWVELCGKDEFRAPGVSEVGISARGDGFIKPRTTRRTRKASTAVPAEAPAHDSNSTPSGQVRVKDEPVDDDHAMQIVHDDGHGSAQMPIVLSPPDSTGSPDEVVPVKNEEVPASTSSPSKAKAKGKRQPQTRQTREANQANRLALDATFLETFEPHKAWLPPDTRPEDYTPEFCQRLERHYWRNCGLGKPAWYGADTQGALEFSLAL